MSNIEKQKEYILSPIYIDENNNKIHISHLFYVKLKKEEDYDILDKLAKAHNVEIVSQNKYLPLWYTVSCTDKSEDNALSLSNIFYESGLFAASEPSIMPANLLASTNVSSFPNDPLYSYQWNLDAINWSDAYALSSGSNVMVGLIDTGMENLHPDYDPSFFGFDTLNPTYDSPNVCYGNPHGTMCAGVIYATVNNNKGIAGMADGVSMLSVCHPMVSRPNITQELAIGLCYALSASDVVSCSWGGSDLVSTQIEDAFTYYMPWGRDNKGTVVVCAAGNEGVDSISFPASCNNKIITVGAVGTNLTRSADSNRGTKLDVVAPGEHIKTTTMLEWGVYSEFSGTSAACPHVAAIAATILSVKPNLTNTQVADIIESTAQKVGGYVYSNTTGRTNGTWNNEMGYGLVDAYAAVQKAINNY